MILSNFESDLFSDFLKKNLIAYNGITLKSENSNGHNFITQPIWMDGLPLDSLHEGLSNNIYFVSGHGS